jgi:hypothetical protein
MPKNVFAVDRFLRIDLISLVRRRDFLTKSVIRFSRGFWGNIRAIKSPKLARPRGFEPLTF